MKILVTVKHNGIKKLLLPALAKIKNIQFDVLLHNLSGILKKDNCENLNIIINQDMHYILRPNSSLEDSLKKIGISLNSYDAFIMAGLTSIPHVLKEFKNKVILYTVAPFYRAQVPEVILNDVMKNRSTANTIVVHSTPNHYDEYKSRYENKYIKNTILLAHGLNPDAWGNWNGNKKETLTVWGGWKSRILGKSLKFKDKVIKGHEMITELLNGVKHTFSNFEEFEMRESLKNYRFHLFFMKDQQTIGLVESLRIGIPIVGPHLGLTDIDKFMAYGYNGFFSDDGYKLKYIINELINDDKYAKTISKNAQETCDQCFNFNRFVMNWERLLTNQFDNIHIEQPKIYRKYK